MRALDGLGLRPGRDLVLQFAADVRVLRTELPRPLVPFLGLLPVFPGFRRLGTLLSFVSEFRAVIAGTTGTLLLAVLGPVSFFLAVEAYVSSLFDTFSGDVSLLATLVAQDFVLRFLFQATFL